MISTTYSFAASFYDIISSPFKNSEVTNQEIELLQKYIKSTSNVLDIGCGTGRHFLPLLKLGIDVEGIEESSKMLGILRNRIKDTNLKLFNKSFLSFKSQKKYNMIYSFWNTFNEICLTQKQAFLFFRKIYSLLSSGGYFLLNIDDREKFDYRNLKYKTQFTYENKNYILESKVVKFFGKYTLTKTKEEIFVEEGGVFKKIRETYIYQRWWGREEIEKIAQRNQFKIKLERISANDEFYFVFYK